GLAGPAAISETLGRDGLWLTELTPLTPDLESAPGPAASAGPRTAAGHAGAGLRTAMSPKKR
ncbi:hypothetical protein AB0J67_37680, partial [Catellatospora sp. NPDC049609]